MTEVRERADSYLDENIRKRERERAERALPFILAAVAGFCLSKVDVLSYLSPFASAFISAVPFEYVPGVFIGSVVGYMSQFSLEFTLRHVAGLCLICVVRLFVHKRFKKLENGWFLCLLSLFAECGGALCQQLVEGVSFLGVAVCVLEGGIALCSSYFFLRSFRLPLKRVGIDDLPSGDKISLGISVFVFIMCSSGISVEGFSPVRMCCFFVLCVASYCKGISLGGVTGVCLGAALSIAPETRFVFPAFALSGVISGVFAPMGQIALGISACLTFCACCVVGGLEEDFILPMLECGVASAVFMLIPSVYISRVAEKIKKSGAINDECVNLQVASILKQASDNIYSFCQTVDDVSQRLDRIINPEVNKLFFDIQQKVCDGCSEKSACWNNSFDETAGDILAVMGIEKRTGKLKIEKNCARLHELKRYVSHGRAQYSLSMLGKTKNREMRYMLTEQFSGMGDFLNELSDKIIKRRTSDNVKSMALRSVVIDNGVYVDALTCFCCNEGRLEIEISSFERPLESDYEVMKSVLEKATGCVFDEPVVSVTELGTFISFVENPPYYLLAGMAQRPFVKDAPCGDSVAFCKKNDVNSAVVLSDGMGTGSSAALDSTMAVSLMEKLLCAGFSFESAIKLVNSSLIMKSTDESMATVDGLCVNLYTGLGEFYKAGAAISFIRSDREVFVVEESSLPLGILREVSFAKVCFELKPGDIVLLVSDGVTAGDCGWINDELLSWSTNNMEELASHIVELAALRQDRLAGDDLTAVAVKLCDKAVSLVNVK